MNEPLTDLDPLLAFPSEIQPAPPPEAAPRPAWRLVAAGALSATLVFAAFELTRTRWFEAGDTSAGALTVDTQPAGAEVAIDGEPRGVTPLTMTLRPGQYTVAVRLDGLERTRPITLPAGGSAAQYFELAPAATPPPDASTSALAGATAPPLDPDTPAPPPGSVGGWLSVESPFEVRVLEGGEVVGVSSTPRIMLTAGRHQVTFSNQALDYIQTATVTINPGRRTTFVVDPPTVTLNVNARPWADVSIDNAEAGQTPIANLPVTLGSHQVVFRHPQLGERRQTIVVTASGPNRVSMDMTQGR